ncbi:hypothetical protein NECAME_17324 [Necator americanus]|uniref:Uncharacterized protein n=1 Tax=Necator americanus TaxID=51031 RepID=W2TPZ3_NECAM|nr:hypothetical protein NECAME_17324 [Necator americanus]ETN83838.1 hypothetical protein NECAME_17324 [Necator americanus]
MYFIGVGDDVIRSSGKKKISEDTGEYRSKKLRCDPEMKPNSGLYKSFRYSAMIKRIKLNEILNYGK